MIRTLLHAKIHAATVTQTNIAYHGSITIDEDLLEATGLCIHERVSVYNITNGNRFDTYIIRGERGSGVIGINGAAARLCVEGDKVIIAGYAQFDESEIEFHNPKIIVITDEANRAFKRA